ncbi:MAG: hypothetical protein QM572_03985 [Nocardioides sp.]|uniref:hypothetical protein n=1 Tax=Nocardioides sp. TaxID=35761 RepID=UPI0039E3D957
MKPLVASVAATLALSGLALLSPSPAHAALSTVSCTKTSTGTCIRGGQFCPSKSKGKYGYSSTGRRYKCTKGHWR